MYRRKPVTFGTKQRRRDSDVLHHKAARSSAMTTDWRGLSLRSSDREQHRPHFRDSVVLNFTLMCGHSSKMRAQMEQRHQDWGMYWDVA